MKDPNDPQNPYAPPRPPEQGEWPDRPPASYVPPGEPGMMGYAWNPGHRKRGGCLTAFLVLAMIANPIVALVYVAGQEFVKRGLPSAPDWEFPVLAVLATANFVCAIGMWNWKKWGVVGSLSLSALAFVINVIIGVPAQSTIMGLSGPLIVVFLVKPLWRGFT